MKVTLLSDNMEVTSINYFGNDGWESFTDFGYTPSSYLHIPRIGDMIKNKYCSTYKVINVYWNLETHSVNIECELVEK